MVLVFINAFANLQEMESRYNAALQLYGEKVEEADELRMDLEDVKQMYKQQVLYVEKIYIGCVSANAFIVKHI